jgi:hypothetical protein
VTHYTHQTAQTQFVDASGIRFSDCAVTADAPIGGSADLCADQATPAKPDYDRGSLYTLALGTFAVGTEGFMIAAILPSIATSLGTSVQAAGQLATIFALAYALSSPILTALTAAWPRRRLLMVSLAGFVVANLIAAVAPGYWWLAGARVLLALAAGLYVPNANAVGNALAPQPIAAARWRSSMAVLPSRSRSVFRQVPSSARILAGGRRSSASPAFRRLLSRYSPSRCPAKSQPVRPPA